MENAASDGPNSDVNLDIRTDVTVPDDFPSGFPLPDGTLTAAVSMDGGWQLDYNINDASIGEEIVARFTSYPDYEATVNSDMGQIHAWTYTSDE